MLPFFRLLFVISVEKHIFVIRMPVQCNCLIGCIDGMVHDRIAEAGCREPSKSLRFVVAHGIVAPHDTGYRKQRERSFEHMSPKFEQQYKLMSRILIGNENQNFLLVILVYPCQHSLFLKPLKPNLIFPSKCYIKLGLVY